VRLQESERVLVVRDLQALSLIKLFAVCFVVSCPFCTSFSSYWLFYFLFSIAAAVVVVLILFVAVVALQWLHCTYSV